MMRNIRNISNVLSFDSVILVWCNVGTVRCLIAVLYVHLCTVRLVVM